MRFAASIFCSSSTNLAFFFGIAPHAGDYFAAILILCGPRFIGRRCSRPNKKAPAGLRGEGVLLAITTKPVG
jgi:hypothetical protein